MNFNISRKFMIGFSLAVAILVVNTLVAKTALQRQFEAADAVTESLRVIGDLREIQVDSVNLEIAQRSYILTGDPRHLSRASDALFSASAAIARLMRPEGGHPSTRRDAAELNALIARETEKIDQVHAQHTAKGFQAAMKALSANGAAAVDRIHHLVSELSDAEGRRLDRRTEESRQSADLGRKVFFAAALFDLALLCFIYFLAQREVSERRHADKLLRHNATHDSLTALPNRTALAERLHKRLGQPNRDPLAVLLVDLDRFKNINDTLGHEAGDRLLQNIARRLQGCVRRGDTVARHGGDEFVVVLEGCGDVRNVASVAEKILAEVAKPLFLGGREFHITACIGISIHPEDGADMSALLKHAEIAMYRAKEQNANAYRFYARQMNSHSVERLAMESGLRHAMQRGELSLHYQPKVCARSGRLTGMEALLRWRHPELGMISPDRFIPLAEETGLIIPIGDWVIKTASAQNLAWQRMGLPQLTVAVNLSARQFTRQGFAQDVKRTLEEVGLEARWLELEITESMVMLDPEQACETMRELKAMGLSLAIDDFGSGYSSLAYLKRFPIDSLKIDQAFIRGLPDDADDMAITQTIIGLGHSLRLRIVAEGVENEQQAAYLRAERCDEMQGFLFSEAVPAEEFAKMLVAQRAKTRDVLRAFTSKKAIA
jgi:diguanylate cyclase (GGDEF)-like protein